MTAYAQAEIVRFDQRSFGLNCLGQLFFQPLQFHHKASNVLVESFLPFLLLVLEAGSRTADHDIASLQEWARPFAHLMRRHARLAGQLVERLQPLSGVYGPLPLALGTGPGAFLRQRVDPPLGWLMIARSHLQQWSGFWGQL